MSFVYPLSSEIFVNVQYFSQLYIEDSLGERLWVDSEHCKCFVENIIASVNTKPSPRFDFESGTRTDIEEEPPDYLVAPRCVSAFTH